jgi:predicted hydrocarbon binding protein
VIVAMDDLAEVLDRAQEAVHTYHAALRREPESARVSIDSLPHVLVPRGVIGADLLRILDDLVGAPGAGTVMYRLGQQIGARQAAAFLDHCDGHGADVRFRLLTWPLHLAWSGYGTVSLLVWEPHLDGRFAVLWESENSCCATEALAEGRRARACHLLAGYSAGWSAQATGLPIAAAELSCRAEGVGRCRFLLAHPDGLDEHLRDARFYGPSAEYPRLDQEPRRAG